MRYVIMAVIMFASLTAEARGSRGGGSSRSSNIFGSHVYVRSYARSTGTVTDHYRTSRDNTQYNNWISRPNVNPYTGKVGTRTPRY